MKVTVSKNLTKYNYSKVTRHNYLKTTKLNISPVF